MEACAENDVAFVVFDRPNPLGGTSIEGPLLEDDFKMKEWLNYLAGMDLIALIDVIEEEELTREDLLLLLETPNEFADSIKAYHLY